MPWSLKETEVGMTLLKKAFEVFRWSRREIRREMSRLHVENVLIQMVREEWKAGTT